MIAEGAGKVANRFSKTEAPRLAPDAAGHWARVMSGAEARAIGAQLKAPVNAAFHLFQNSSAEHRSGDGVYAYHTAGDAGVIAAAAVRAGRLLNTYAKEPKAMTEKVDRLLAAVGAVREVPEGRRISARAERTDDPSEL